MTDDGVRTRSVAEGALVSEKKQPSRAPWRAVAWVTASTLVVSGLIATPAGATTDPGVTTDPGATLTVPDEVVLEGLLRVVPVEPAFVDGDETAPAPGAPTESIVTLVTESGQNVELSGDTVPLATSGDRFSGTVTVPGEVADAVEQVVEDGEAGESTVEELVVDASVLLDAPLEVVDADVTPIVEAAVASKAHTVDVMYAAPAGQPVPSLAEIDGAVARMSTFWSTQSNGQIARVTRPGAVKYATLSAATICDPDAMWNYAAGPSGFNRPPTWGTDRTSYYWGATRSVHLVVIVPGASCGPGNGLGTVSPIHTGGTIWASVFEDPLDWDQVLFHEFGHNVGLGHSNVASCTYPKIDAADSDSACQQIVYADYYDVMGGGYSTGELSNQRNVAALNVTHKAHLDALPRGASLRVVTAAGGATQRFTLAPASAASGVRGLEITDPLGTGKMYVEFRSGTGRDAQSFYTRVSSGPTPELRFAPGVRILRIDCALPATCDGAGSRVLQRWMTDDAAALSHPAGTEFSSYKTNANGAGVRVSVVSTSSDGAVVDVTFDSQVPAFTTKGAVRITGTPSYFRELRAAVATAWSPTPAAYTYQWLRDGAPIPGATAETYRVRDADRGAALTVRVTASAAGRSPSTAISPAVTVPLTYPDVAISGTVRLPAGTPTSVRTGMTVRAYAIDGGPSVFRPTGFADVDAATGAYRIAGLVPGEWRLQVVPRGGDDTTPGPDVAAQWYGGAPVETGSQSVRAGADAANVDFTLTRSPHITGTVTLPAGVPSAWRRAITVTATPIWVDGERSTARASTAPVNTTTGAYTLTGLDPGSYHVRFLVAEQVDGTRVALAPEWYDRSFRESGATVLVVRNADLGGVDTTLTPTRTISGTAALPAGAPAGWRSHLRVVVTDADGTQTTGTVGTGGAFSVPYLTPGEYAVCLEIEDEVWDDAAGGWVHQTTLVPSCLGGAYTADQSPPVDATAGNVSGVQLTASQGRAMSGTISLPAGTPTSYREDTYVEAIPVDAQGHLDLAAGTSMRVDAATGRYRIGNLIPGRYLLRVSPQSYVWDPVAGTSVPTQLALTWYGGAATAAGASVVDVSTADSTTVNVALVRATASLSGTVDVTALRGATGTVDSLVISLVDAAGSEVIQTNLVSGGAYTLTGLLPGSYRALLISTIRRGTSYENSTQYLERADGSGVVTVAANAQVTGVALTAAAATASIRGSLTTAGFSGSFASGALAEARLYVQDGSTWVGFPDALASAYTDETRMFTSSLLAAGSYTVGYEGLPAAFRIAGSSLVQEWWKDESSLATADAVALAAGATRLGMHGAVHPAGVTPPVVVDPVLTWMAPTVVGIPKVGAPLLVSLGRWTPGVSFSYQWSVGGVDVAGARTANFTPRAADVGKTVTVRVAGRKDGYAPVVSTSAPSAAVLPATMTAPTPTISGTAKAGLTLTAKPGTWTKGVTFSYQWYVAGARVSGATKVTFIPRSADVGKTATVRVTGSHPAYAPVARMSRATAKIAAYSRLTVGTPTIAGTPKAGLTLTARPGTWTSGTTFSYQWYVGGATVSGATKATFVPGGGHVGKTVTVKVTGRKPGYLTASKVSRATAKVAAYSRLTVGTPTIAGTPKVGLTLTARAGTWTSGTTFTYQWYVAGAAVSGATRTTFVPRAADVGEVVTVKVTGRKAGYLTASKVSAATARVVA